MELVKAGETKTAETKGPGGRPSTYQPKYCYEMVEFFASAPLLMPEPDLSETQPLKREVKAVCGSIPTFERFATQLGCAMSTLTDWRNKYPEFAAAYARCKAIQSDFFIQGLSRGIMNPTGAIFVAKNVLGWRDKVDIESTSTVIEAGQTIMAQCLAAASPDQLATFRALIDAMKSQAIQAGLLNQDGSMVRQLT